MHSSVIDAAVVGVDFEDGRGELPRAYVVIDQASPSLVTKAEIHAHMSDLPGQIQNPRRWDQAYRLDSKKSQR